MGMPEYYPFRSAQAKAEYWDWYDRWTEPWPVARETRMVETALGKTCIHISGSTAAPPLVLLPGMGSTSFCWQATIAELPRHYRTYALDSIVDYGRSMASRPIKSADLTGWLDDVLSALGLRSSVNMAGISLGAWLSSQYALRHPERLRRLVRLAPVGITLPVSWKGMLRAMLSNLSPRRFLRPSSTRSSKKSSWRTAASCRCRLSRRSASECWRSWAVIKSDVWLAWQG